MQNDYGFTIGVLPCKKVQAEVGIDSFLPGITKSHLYLNGKIVIPEGALSKTAPGFSFGIVGAGFEHNVSDFNVLHATTGKTFRFGNVVAGAYYGLNAKLMVSSTGRKQQAGALGAWTSPDLVLGLRGLKKINVIADIQSGKNAFGAWGIGTGFYFTEWIDVLTGPVFFFDSLATTQLHYPGSERSGRPKRLWTIQLDIDLSLRKAK